MSIKQLSKILNIHFGDYQDIVRDVKDWKLHLSAEFYPILEIIKTNGLRKTYNFAPVVSVEEITEEEAVALEEEMKKAAEDEQNFMDFLEDLNEEEMEEH